MLHFLGSLDLGDVISISLALFAFLFVLWSRARSPIDPETKKFAMEMIRSEKDKIWSLLVVVLFLYAIFHTGQGSPLVETFKTLVAGAVGWIGNMLQGSGRDTTKPKPDEPVKREAQP